MRRRPNFTVASSVVLLFIVLAFLASFIRPLVPAPPPNVIASYPGDYLEAAASQQIDWYPANTQAFAEARRLDRPVLIFVGVEWSQAARDFDSDVLTTADVQNYLSHNFVCIRIDGGEDPAWVSAYLPVTRVGIGIRSRFQIWALEPDGTLIGSISRKLPTTTLSETGFINDLVSVHQFYTQLRQQTATSPMQAQQKADIAQIEAPSTPPTVDFSAMLAALKSTADTVDGGFPQNGFQDLHPTAWQFLAQVGDKKLLHDTLMPELRSQAFDVLDGGFYMSARDLEHQTMEFDKSAVNNAEMSLALAQAEPYLTSPDDKRLCDYALRATTSSLIGEFGAGTDFVKSARIGDEEDDGRSSRSSITPQEMRDALNPSEREWARAYLGLRVESNPQMLMYMAGTQSLEQVDEVRGKLLTSAAPGKYSTGFYMDVNGTVAARLMETGRATNDANLVNIGSQLFSRIDQERVGDTVPHDLQVAGRSQPTLQDYLAYSDAALEDYLTSGRVPSLQNGIAVLQRGLSIFAGPVPGELQVGLPPSADLLPTVTTSPEIVDDLGESTSAKALRLCAMYGRLLLGSGDDANVGVGLVRTAYASEALLAQPTGGLGIPAVSFACASLDLVDDRYAVAIGPQAQQLADQLYRLRPTRLVAPAFGPVHAELLNRAPGIYVIAKGVVSGPFSASDAAEHLPAVLTPS